MLPLLFPPALACGGLFCTAVTLPVDQTGERIVFAIDQDAGKIEMHTQIAYEGPAEQFAWLVPLPSEPDLFLSTDELFTFLDRNTAPIFQLTTQCECCDVPDADSDNGSVDSGEPGGGVTIVASKAVGPYDTVVLQGTSSEVLLTWLNDNGYYIPGDVSPYLDPYVAENAYIVALKLQKNRDLGDLEPLGVRYDGDTPMIPLTMTAVAAQPDMSLIPWVLSTGRAVPENYLHVVINELAIDWWTSGSNYPALVSAAADEAGGQAFATDFAGPTDTMRDQLLPPGRFDVAALRATTTLRGLWGAILSQGFILDDRLVGLLEDAIPGAQAVLTDLGVGGDTGFIGAVDTSCDDPERLGCDPVNTGPAVDKLESDVITPLQAANDLFDRYPYITRLTSSASPEEMTVDPRFVINPDLPDVAQRRTATVTAGDCDDDGFNRLTLADGTWVDIPTDQNPTEYMARFADIPALRIESTGRSGAPVVVSDAAAEIEALRSGLPSGEDALDDDKETSSCGCASSTGRSSALSVALTALWALSRSFRARASRGPR